MNVYIWKHIEKVSDRYHEDGGVVVFAETEEMARALANSDGECKIKPEEMPDHVRSCADGPEMVFIFPNAGCC